MVAPALEAGMASVELGHCLQLQRERSHRTGTETRESSGGFAENKGDKNARQG